MSVARTWKVHLGLQRDECEVDKEGAEGDGATPEGHTLRNSHVTLGILESRELGFGFRPFTPFGGSSLLNFLPSSIDRLQKDLYICPHPIVPGKVS